MKIEIRKNSRVEKALKRYHKLVYMPGERVISMNNLVYEIMEDWFRFARPEIWAETKKRKRRKSNER